MRDGSGTKAMRRDRDARARKNAFHYIASWRREWDEDSFLTSGEEDFARLVAPVLRRCGLPASGRAMLELGCGAGRMTRSFAKRFERVYAFDLSPEMLRRGREIHKQQSNILWLLGNGADLSSLSRVRWILSSATWSCSTFPRKRWCFSTFRSCCACCVPAARFCFSLTAGLEPTMNLRGRAAWGIVDALWSLGLGGVSRAMAAMFGFDPCAAGKSWRGAAIDARRMQDGVRQAGGEVRELSGENTPMTWCCGVTTGKQD